MNRSRILVLAGALVVLAVAVAFVVLR
ncbi:MAG: hypothetical protein QOJ35_2608, partial [Solirubrobacteraceae bacterium]|nr:hypothetical protein [Solirubrobacteraceae bacterium]